MDPTAVPEAVMDTVTPAADVGATPETDRATNETPAATTDDAEQAAPPPPTDADASPTDEPTEPIDGLSKRAKRKMELAAHRKEAKKARRATEKQQGKDKKQQQRADKEAALAALSPEERAATEKAHAETAQAARQERSANAQAQEARLVEAETSGTHLVVDMRWADDQLPRELKSLCFQLGQCYASNRRCPTPAKLVFAGMSEATLGVLKGVATNPENWRGARIDHTPIVDLYKERKADVVYLSADAEESLGAIDPGTVYVIGGMLDHNSKKGATFAHAKTEQIRTARLPLDEHVTMVGSKVLTVNQCVDMLLLVMLGQSEGLPAKECWRLGITNAVPQRKVKGFEKGQGVGPPAGGASMHAFAVIKAAAKEWREGREGGAANEEGADNEGAETETAVVAEAD